MPEYHVRLHIRVVASVDLPNREDLNVWIVEHINVAHRTEQVSSHVSFSLPEIWERGVPHDMEFTREYLDAHPCQEDEQWLIEDIHKNGDYPVMYDISQDEYTTIRSRMEYERMVYEGIIQKPPPF